MDQNTPAFKELEKMFLGEALAIPACDYIPPNALVANNEQVIDYLSPLEKAIFTKCLFLSHDIGELENKIAEPLADREALEDQILALQVTAKMADDFLDYLISRRVQFSKNAYGLRVDWQIVEYEVTEMDEGIVSTLN